jgi:pre-mRNA-splicing factor SYF1
VAFALHLLRWLFSGLVAMGVIDDLMPADEDLLYEEELLRNPYALKMWVRYLAARTGATAKRRYLLYERAVKALPGSYKVGQVGVRLQFMAHAC